jgi:chemotaxis protein CheZ
MTSGSAGRRTGQTSVRGSLDEAVRTELQACLKELSAQQSRCQPSEIAAAVESVMATVDGDLSAVNLKLYAEIEALSRYIANAKAEISQVRPDEIRSQHLPTATDELEAIVGATEQATNTIFEAVEGIEEIAATLDDATAQKITDQVTRVYEACSFQDITGQRISKVVSTLQQIESKVDALLEAFGEEAAHAQAERRKRASETDTAAAPADTDRGLMNGPAAPGSGQVSQADIDALLASFD